MKIVCLSDTHCQMDRVKVPYARMLIHAGDLTFNGSLESISKELGLISVLPHKYKLVIAGNHDWCFDNILRRRVEEDCEKLGIIYLRDREITIDGIKFYGSPWQPRFHDWAFNLDRGPQIAEKWAAIPDDTEVLITHGPPYNIGDPSYRGERVGCQDLLARIKNLPKLQAHIFGHIHAGYGQYEQDGVKFINASICNERYNPLNAPIKITVERRMQT